MSHQPHRRVRVVVADDHPLFAEALVAALSTDPRVEVVGVAANGADAVELALELEPHVVLMDLHMPQLDGAVATYAIVSELPRTRVVVLSSSTEVVDVDRAYHAGASAYVTKSADGATVVREVLRAASSRRAARAA